MVLFVCFQHLWRKGVKQRHGTQMWRPAEAEHPLAHCENFKSRFVKSRKIQPAKAAEQPFPRSRVTSGTDGGKRLRTQDEAERQAPGPRCS